MHLDNILIIEQTKHLSTKSYQFKTDTGLAMPVPLHFAQKLARHGFNCLYEKTKVDDEVVLRIPTPKPAHSLHGPWMKSLEKKMFFLQG
jgi:ligand-binding SRPBCC domain-containing protein